MALTPHSAHPGCMGLGMYPFVLQASAFPSSKWGNGLNPKGAMRMADNNPLSKMLIFGIRMILIGGVFHSLVVHKTIGHLKTGDTLDLMKCGPRNWQCLGTPGSVKCEQPMACLCSFPSFVTGLAGRHRDRRHARGQSSLLRTWHRGTSHGMAGSLLGWLSVISPSEP